MPPRAVDRDVTGAPTVDHSDLIRNHSINANDSGAVGQRGAPADGGLQPRADASRNARVNLTVGVVAFDHCRRFYRRE